MRSRGADPYSPALLQVLAVHITTRSMESTDNAHRHGCVEIAFDDGALAQSCVTSYVVVNVVEQFLDGDQSVLVIVSVTFEPSDEKMAEDSLAKSTGFKGSFFGF